MSYGYGALVYALTKNSYWFLKFSDRPSNCYNYLKIIFCFIKPAPICIELAPRRIPIW
jgi:hypothetical protein